MLLELGIYLVSLGALLLSITASPPTLQQCGPRLAVSGGELQGNSTSGALWD
jgi:hypothetical protein